MREINRRKKVVELNHMLKDGKVPIPRRSSFTDWNYQAELAALQARIGEKFDKALLARAFVIESHVQLEMRKQEELGVEVSTGLVDNSELAREGGEVSTGLVDNSELAREGVEVSTGLVDNSELAREG